jgi:hypothetical protein
MASDVISGLWATVGGIMAPHGPALAASPASYAPGDVSVHFFLQLAAILFACRVVGWLANRFAGQPQGGGNDRGRGFGPLPVH